MLFQDDGEHCAAIRRWYPLRHRDCLVVLSDPSCKCQPAIALGRRRKASSHTVAVHVGGVV